MNTLALPEALEDTEVTAVEALVRRFAHFEQDAVRRRQQAWLTALRKAGLARFAELGFPTTAEEDWRFTSLAPLLAQPLEPVVEPGPVPLTRSELARFPFHGLAGPRLVFVDGHYAPTLSDTDLPPGVTVRALSAALRSPPPFLEQHLGRHARPEDSAFIALSNAYFQDGACLQIAPGQQVAEPIRLLFISTGTRAGATSHPRNLVVAGRSSAATVIESYVSTGSQPTFTNAVTELVAEEQAVVEHVRFQDEDLAACHVGALQAQVGRDARVQIHSFALGARLSRQNLRTVLDGEGLECVLNGLYLVRGDQLADHHMVVDHARPHGASHEYFNGILAGKAHGVFHGRILVRAGAQKTDAKQTNKNLLLSDDATVNTKPQLEIYADDVKCTHGATIGQLHPESIFYLRSRGIPLETARRILIHAFAGEIIDRVRATPVRQELEALVWDRLEGDERVRVGGKAELCSTT